MASNTVIVGLLIVTSSLQHVTSFATNRHHGGSTDLADALRMLERQRRRINNEQHVWDSNSEALGEEGTQDWKDEQSSYNAALPSPPGDDVSATWLANVLGLGPPPVEELVEEKERLPGDFRAEQLLLDSSSAPFPPPSQDKSTEDKLNAIFGEKRRDDDDDDDVNDNYSSVRVQKKDKEVMTNIVNDVKPQMQTRSSASAAHRTLSPTTEDTDQAVVTKNDFKALLSAVEELQEEALEKAEEQVEKAQEVAEEVEEKVAEAREVARQAEQEAAALDEEEEEGRILDLPESQSPGDGDLYEEQSAEVIPTGDGEIIKTDRTLKDAEGHAIGMEETVEQLQTAPREEGLSSEGDLWFLNKYLDGGRNRRKRKSKRGRSRRPSATPASSVPNTVISPYSAELMETYVRKIEDLKSELQQVKMVSYLEDVENDLLTDALSEATSGQTRGHVNPKELGSLENAILVEGALQEVKSDKLAAKRLSEDLADDVAEMFNTEDEREEKEQWRKRSDVVQPEVPVFVASDDSYDVSDDKGNDSGKESGALVLNGRWADRADEESATADDLLDALNEEGLDLNVDNSDSDLIQGVGHSNIASLFSDTADQCPAVQKLSTNCQFAGLSIDYEARALCNVHQLCYVCGATLSIRQEQCDFIYRAASILLCQEDEDCVMEADLFLNTMKLKHRYLPYTQRICTSQCTAEFLSIV